MGEVARGGCCPPMDLFRSEPMQLIQLIIPIESAHCTVSYLGDLGLLQFKDVSIHLFLNFFLDKPFLTSFLFSLVTRLWLGFIVMFIAGLSIYRLRLLICLIWPN